MVVENKWRCKLFLSLGSVMEGQPSPHGPQILPPKARFAQFASSRQYSCLYRCVFFAFSFELAGASYQFPRSTYKLRKLLATRWLHVCLRVTIPFLVNIIFWHWPRLPRPCCAVLGSLRRNRHSWGQPLPPWSFRDLIAGIVLFRKAGLRGWGWGVGWTERLGLTYIQLTCMKQITNKSPLYKVNK